MATRSSIVENCFISAPEALRRDKDCSEKRKGTSALGGAFRNFTMSRADCTRQTHKSGGSEIVSQADFCRCGAFARRSLKGAGGRKRQGGSRLRGAISKNLLKRLSLIVAMQMGRSDARLLPKEMWRQKLGRSIAQQS